MARARLATRLLFVSLLCASATNTAWAQSAVTGGITGLVRDTTGAVLPGVTVEASSPTLIEKVRSVVTDEEGRYNIIELRPGTYTVTFTLPGFSPVRREGIELTAGFTAPVNAELRVGSVEETVVVSTAAPVVDTQNVRTQNVLSRDVLDTLPTGRNLSGYVALTLGMSVAGAPDVGGITGELNGNLSIHGTAGSDQRYTMDGMSYNWAASVGGGFNRIYFVNHGATQEVALETGGMSAETETGGVQMNVIPKDGGNTLNGVVHIDGSGNRFLSENATPPPTIRRLYDFYAGVGGPVVTDRIWFYGAFRKNEASQNVLNNYFNRNQSNITNGVTFYAPDFSRPAYTSDQTQDESLRVTWQVAAKHKITIGSSIQQNCLCFYGTQFNLSPEATSLIHFRPKLHQGTWTYPATHTLLVRLGATYMPAMEPIDLPPGVTPAHIPIRELSTGYSYNGVGGPGGTSAPNPPGFASGDQTNGVASVSYVPGSHSFKVGVQWFIGTNEAVTTDQSPILNYTFNGGVPASVTYLAKPFRSVQKVRNIGLFVQDQWALRRVTLNLGVRLDTLRGLIPPQTRPAGPFAAALVIPEISDVPNWNDIMPRVGVAYDLFGNGKTSLKASVGHYVQTEAVQLAADINPANAIVTSATRTWNDANRDYIPQDTELGPLSDNAFGTTRVTTRYAPEVLNGWGVRPDSWQAAVSVQHELLPGVALNAGYYHTWFSNFRVRDNLSVTPADYDPYCITVPLDARLPGGGGNQLCGLYDLSPARIGQVNNLVTRGSNFGTFRQFYDGADVSVNARAGRQLRFGGGIIAGRSILDDCVTVDSPSLQAVGLGVGTVRPAGFCRAKNQYAPSQTGNRPTNGVEAKFNASYTFPWDIEASAVYQNTPGYAILANVVVPNAQIAPSLGRNLSACGAAAVCNAFVIIPVIEHDRLHLDRYNQLDVRLSKRIRLAGRSSVRGMIDLYNIVNANDPTGVNYTYGSSWLNPTNRLLGRLVKFGVEFQF